MSKCSIVHDNLLNHKTKYIMHQTNCLTKKTHPSNTHIATQLFKKYPSSNVYNIRSQTNTEGIPGTIVVIGKVINLMAQKYPGKAYWSGGKAQRVKYFSKCLGELKKYFCFHKSVTIGFPYRIGCGLGGGDWDEYSKMLNDFNKQNKNITLIMYKINKHLL